MDDEKVNALDREARSIEYLAERLKESLDRAPIGILPRQDIDTILHHAKRIQTTLYDNLDEDLGEPAPTLVPVKVRVELTKTDTGFVTVEILDPVSVHEVMEATKEYFAIDPLAVYEVEEGSWEVLDWNEVESI